MEPNSTAAPEGATALTTNDDAAILAAWQRMNELRKEIDAIDDTDKDGHLWEAFHCDEHVIQGCTAATIAGAEIQLWCHLLHSVPSAHDERAVLGRDLARFLGREDQYDWTERLVFSAIRSLRAIGGAA